MCVTSTESLILLFVIKRVKNEGSAATKAGEDHLLFYPCFRKHMMKRITRETGRDSEKEEVISELTTTDLKKRNIGRKKCISLSISEEQHQHNSLRSSS
jgi:hypothetical protein